MSRSSRAVASGIFHKSMQKAAPILFWVALLIFILTAASHFASPMFVSDLDQTDVVTKAYLIFTGLAQGLINAAVPFTGAALVSVFQERAEGGAE